MLRKVRVILSFSFRNVWSVKCILLLFKYSNIQVYFKGLLNLHLLKTYCRFYGEYLVKYYLKKEFISPYQFFILNVPANLVPANLVPSAII